MSYSLTFGFDGGGTGVSPLRAQLVDTSGASVGSAVTTGFVEIGSNFYMWTGTIPDGHVGGVKFYDNDTPSTILAFASINPQEAEYTDAKTSTRSSHSAANVRTEMDSNSTKLAYLTGDAYARLGAPSGASIAADIAQVTTNTNTTNSRLTSTRAGYLDELAAANIPADVDALLARLTSTRAGYLDNLSTAPPTAAAIATAVWGAVSRTLTSSGAITPDDIADIVDAVLDELLSGHTTAGSLGKAIGDLAASSGTGSVTVDHDYGGEDALAFQTAGGVGIDGGIIRAYLASDVTASGYSGAAVRGRATTDSNGAWTTPMYLDPGSYILAYALSDETLVTRKTVTVS